MTFVSYLYDLRQYSYGEYCSTWRRVLEQITAFWIKSDARK